MRKHKCPTCGHPLTCPACSGAKGGGKTGPTKARKVTSEAARAAINARWERVRKARKLAGKM